MEKGKIQNKSDLETEQQNNQESNENGKPESEDLEK